MGHQGLMVCKCAHDLGLVPFPLDASCFHLDECKWTCCDQEWSEAVCTAADNDFDRSLSQEQSPHSSIKSPKSPAIPRDRAVTFVYIIVGPYGLALSYLHFLSC